MSVIAEQETQVCPGCGHRLPRAAYSAASWEHRGYCRSCRRRPTRRVRELRDSAREVEELLERVGALEHMVAQLLAKVA